jgi:hypothetical protein
MTDEELKAIEERWSKVSEGHWQMIVGRKEGTPLPNGKPSIMSMLRFDVFAGPKLPGDGPHEMLEINPGYRQICHFHPLKPNPWMNLNENASNDIQAIAHSKEDVEKLLQEIRLLKALNPT